MRTPKPPAGFVPVDSEEGKKIDSDRTVNVARSIAGEWVVDSVRMATARAWAISDQAVHYHVQLPPPVEWEEVWGWGVSIDSRLYITKNGLMYQPMGNIGWTESQLDTIVRALNEMETQ